MVMRERDTGFEEGVPFRDRVEVFRSSNPKVLWGVVKESEVEFPKFAFYAGNQIIEKCGAETLLKFLKTNDEKDKLKNKDLEKLLEEEAVSRMKKG